MIYFFQIGEGPKLAYDVNLEGLITDDTVNGFHHKVLAKKHAELLSEFTTMPVTFYPKGKEIESLTINNYKE